MFNPKTDRYRKIPSEKHENIYSGRIIQQKKQCQACPHFAEAKVIPNDNRPSIELAILHFSEGTAIKMSSIKKTPEEENSAEEDKVFGICTLDCWKVIYKVEKPRKCLKIQC